MAGPDELGRLLGLLGQFRGGTLKVTVGEVPVVDLDPARKNLAFDVGLLDGNGPGQVSILHEHRIGMWRALGFARSLDHIGWQIILEKEGKELLWMGRDISALTGHIRADVGALARSGELGRIL